MAIKFSGLKSIKGQVKIKNKKTNNNIIQNPNVYSGSVDDTVKKIDSSGNELWTFTGHTNTVLSVAVDPGLYPIFW